MPFDREFWKQWEGHRADAEFPLERCTGEGTRGARFDTQFQGDPAAIEIVPATPESIDALRKAWDAAAGLSHPALVRILTHGETTLGDLRCAYIVTERPDENLADVLAERSLTPDETREMLVPLLDALRYLHAQGFAHGALRPANIMAFGDQLKIASDSLTPGGDASADCLAIGVLVEEVLGANRNGRLPEPFSRIVRNCLTADPSARWDVARIEACLRGDPVPAEAGKSRAIWWGAAAAAALVVGLVVFWPARTEPPVQKVEALAPVATPPPVAAEADTKPSPLGTETKEAKKTARPAKAVKEQRVATVDGITQVLPEIPQDALNTITGRVRISVRVRVDGAGAVSQATLEPPAGSKYFSSRALAAARAWKFPAGDAPRDWVLHFELTREQPRVTIGKLGN